MIKTLKNLIYILMVVILIWWGLSTVEIMCKNMQPKPEYSPCNAWVITMEMCRK